MGVSTATTAAYTWSHYDHGFAVRAATQAGRGIVAIVQFMCRHYYLVGVLFMMGLFAGGAAVRLGGRGAAEATPLMEIVIDSHNQRPVSPPPSPPEYGPLRRPRDDLLSHSEARLLHCELLASRHTHRSRVRSFIQPPQGGKGGQRKPTEAVVARIHIVHMVC